MRNVLSLACLLMTILILAACGGNDNDVLSIEQELAAIEAEVGTTTEIDCPLKVANKTEGETYSCGVYTVPVDYAKPDGDTINLTYMVLHATGENSLPDPIVYLAGGPGQSGVVGASDLLYGDLRQARDLIFPAQRGTLFSERLGVEECVTFLADQTGKNELNAFVDQISTNEKPATSLPYTEYLAQYSQTTGEINGRCHEAFTQAGLDPTQFNTANSTNDIVGLLAALGYDSFNLHGISYGTRLALETVRRHPEANIRTVVLDSPAAPTTNRLALLASATHEMVLRLFADCAADAVCNSAYPNLTERTAVLLQQLAAQPLTIDDQTIGADELIRQLSDLTNTRANFIPRLIAELEAGETATYLALLNGEVGTELPEGSLTSPTINTLIQTISAAGVTADDPFSGLKYVGEIIPVVLEDNPREAMKAVAQEQLPDAETLPQILNKIDALTADDINTLQGMYSAPTAPQLDEEETNRLTEAIAKNNAQFLLTGMVCLEQLSFEDVDTAVASRDSLAIPGLATSGALLATEVGNCINYPMSDPDPTYHEPINSDIPILILQGEFDVRTPLENGRSLSEQLSNDTLVIVPEAGHETWTSADGCVGQISIAFISNPEQTPDMSCLAQRQERFSLPDEPLTPSE